MNTEKQDRKDKWEKKCVQRAIDYHNKKYGTNIEVKGRATDVYPCLKGKLNWDWVCYDTKTDTEIAVEVKKLTDEKLEGRQNTIGDILEEVKNDLSNKLPGVFFLSIDTPQYYNLPFNKQGNKQEFKRVLYDVVYRTAQKLELGKTADLEPQIRRQLSFALPDIFPIDLHKFNDEGNALRIILGASGVWSLRLNEDELEKFEELASHANEQLKKANVKGTFLVIIEERLRITDAGTIPDAFTRISPKSYSHVGHAYCVSGEEVTEIPLPTN